jgi:RNA polymerase sigma factor (sigma-70 family)
MASDSSTPRLSRISTIWTVLHKAHHGSADDATTARRQLIERYGGAVHRYLTGILRDPHAADELMQEFALGLVRGDFRNACPERGRFRSYVKTVLAHLVSRYRQRQQAGPQAVAPDSPVLTQQAAPDEEAERAFLERWREELLAQTWEALAEQQGHSYAVLRLRALQPELSSEQLAEHLARQLDRPFTPDGVRQALHRARDKFADLLVEEVAHSLETPNREELAEELRELDLLAYCQPAVESWRNED